ncbi:hypothetical protein FHR22_003090 [Sphingopyxis panaciterrae]|uniref:hypothetical protein n=1 Tax=Sphingopyxis panaciterrae TaxID=363841 RepID=UPI00141E2B76|nr:hypothetical protein [Sphingopyxis panaciterrae]NIJ38379.1 hypothetical protein [Sphingopyxis panaciterrae]
MSNQNSVDQADYEWQRCSLMLPRVGLILSRHGLRTRVILPGDYMVRRSRTLGQRLYRRRSSLD